MRTWLFGAVAIIAAVIVPGVAQAMVQVDFIVDEMISKEKVA